MAQPIDPHKVFSNGTNVNLEDLTFYVELKVTKRNRLGNSNTDKPLIINFLGVNDAGMFTTDWTQSQENFGIKSIDFKMTSSYVPQVDIVFEDVRGQALFNNFSESKYRVIFDMPPPIFDLTLKGYYGQAVTYRLHMLKQNTSFVNNNSFEISASFIGMTFAPLSDMYVDYLEVAPYMSNENLIGGAVDTYLELTESAKKISQTVKTATVDDSAYLRDLSDKNDILKGSMDNYKQNFIDSINAISSTTGGQNNLINVSLDPANSNIVWVAYKYKPLEADNSDKYPNKTIYSQLYTTINDKKSYLKQSGIAFNVIQDIVFYTSLPYPVYTSDRYLTVFKMDFTNIDQGFRNAIKNNNQLITNRRTVLESKVKTVVYDLLAGGPTLDTILSIILGDAERFFNTLKNVVTQAQNDRAGNEDISNGDAPKYAFPLFFKTDSNGRKVKSIPTDESWAEVQFVNGYINAKMKVKAYQASQDSTNFDPQSGSDYPDIPINPFDSIIIGQSPYSNISSSTDIVDLLIQRGNVILSYSNLVNKSTLNKPFVKAYAKIEAQNLYLHLKSSEILLDAFLNKINKDSFTFQTATSPTNTLLAAGNVTSMTGASPNINYGPTPLFKILSDDDLAKSLGVPVLKDDSQITNPTLLIISQSLKSAGAAFTSNNGNGYICQYNIPYFEDQNFKGGWKNKSDYVPGIVTGANIFNDIFYFKVNGLSSFKTADTFINNLFVSNNTIYAPFNMPSFRASAGIVQIPNFILIAWGYILANIGTVNINASDKALWTAIPMDIRNQFIAIYTAFATKFNSDYGGTYYANLLAAENAEDDAKETSIQTFYGTDIVLNMISTKYVLLGQHDIFALPAAITKNAIVYSTTATFYDDYFNTLKLELIAQKTDVKKTITAQNNVVKANVNNSDLKTELYYTFKSFVDKWMLNTPDNVTNMFSKSNFLMVDRAFNNIGTKVMLDLTPIFSQETTPDTSLYTLLLNLLSKNNFEFFALPSYIEYGNSGILWSDSNINKVFGTHQEIPTTSNSKFICMYVGGTSSQLDIGLPNSHEDDSAKFEEITDLNQVQAFKVEFGTGNQSFFHGLELDQLEFKETNESIKLLDNIAQSGANPTQTSSNSIYNVYEQRSYTATFNMMGNMMIQPTMYFDLTNVAMFKGTYLILEVNHHISANSINSSFKGVRVPVVPKPYVTDFTVLANVDLGAITGLNSGAGDVPATTTNSKITTNDVKSLQSALSYLGVINNPALSNQQKALLDVIAYAEGTLGLSPNNGYDIIVTGKKIQAWKTDYQLGHGLKQWYQASADSTAAGRYQFLGNTWLGISTGTDSVTGGPNKAFNSSNQDLTCIKKVNERLAPYKLTIPNITEANFVAYTDSLAPEWASFPYYRNTTKYPPARNTAWSAGKGFYTGQGGRYSKEELWIVYSLSLKKYNGGTLSEADLDTLVNQFNAKLGDTKGVSKVDQKLKLKYGDLDVLHKNMTASDRKTDKNAAFISKYIINWVPPADIKSKIPALGNGFEINKDCQTALEATFRNLISSSLSSEINTFDGSFNIRSKRLSNTISVHSYGLAIDLNAATNPQGGSVSWSDAFLNVWKNNNFTVGAEFQGKSIDGMHFEYTQII